MCGSSLPQCSAVDSLTSAGTQGRGGGQAPRKRLVGSVVSASCRMSNMTPYHLEARLRGAMAGAWRLAEARGLVRVFESELFSVIVRGQEALDSGIRGFVERALEEVRLLEAEIAKTEVEVSSAVECMADGTGRGAVPRA